jgi:signal transduction histidine kinase
MIFKRKHFPIFVFFLFTLLFWSSCQKKSQHSNEDYQTTINKAEEYFHSGEYEKAYAEYFKIKALCTEDEADKIVYAYFRLADILNKRGDYVECEDIATSASQYFSNCKKQDYVNAIYNCLGINYLQNQNYQNALKYYNKALTNSSRLIDQLTIKNNIAVVYLEKKDLGKTVEILQNIIKEDTLIANKTEYARALDNLGYTKYKLQDESSINYLNQSFKIRDSIGDDYETTASLMHLSEYYLIQNPKFSYQYALQAYEAASRVNNPDDRLEALDFLIKNANNNEFKKYYSLHSVLNDSITKERQTAKNQFANIKYNTGKAWQEAKLQKTQKYIYILLLILLSGVGAYILAAIRKKNRLKLKTISYETEIRISKKIHDELANDVFNALTYADTQNLSDSNKKEKLLENLDTIYTRTRNISQENSEIDTGENYPKQLTDLLAQYNSNKVNVIVNKLSSINWNGIKKESKIALYRVLQELMVNMKKHSQCEVAIISFNQQKNLLIVNYSDNGKGTEMLKSKKGLQNAENRMQVIKGTITFDSETDKGFKARIIIPK